MSIVLVLAAIECLSLLAIALSPGFLGEEIRTTTDIYREQSALIQRLLEPHSARLLALDPLLGWRYRAGHSDSANTISPQGVRSTHPYALRPPPGVTRVAAFGDSFVYGNEVTDSAAWPAQAERLFPGLEVLNYGVGGYGVDQAYLRFCAEGLALSPGIVIIGFTTDDLRRVVNVYRRFISNRELPLAKPRFLFDDTGDLVLFPNPLPRPVDYARYLYSPQEITELGQNDQWYHAAIYRNPAYDYSATVRLFSSLWVRVTQRYFAPQRLLRGDVYNPSSSAFHIQMALFERFASASRAAGARPLIAIFPDRESVLDALRGHATTFAPLVDSLAARGLEYVDLTTAFLNAGLPGDASPWFMPGGHYSPTGNHVVARQLGREVLARVHGAVSPSAAQSSICPPIGARTATGVAARERLTVHTQP